MQHSIVVIPIHKSSPNDTEISSFEQCCRVLRAHPICIVTNNEVNIGQYQEIASQFSINILRENFDTSYFASIAGYNRLMLDKRFYQRFAKYDYMLVYQLDAWAFRDELDNWCNKGYDYIGAPWIEKNDDDSFRFAGVGNGGFSLRRIRHFIDVLGHKGPVRNANQLDLEPTLKNRIYKFFYSRGYQNTVSYYKKDPTLYEDIFLSIFLSNTKLRANMPTPEMAARFAFEKQPSYLYSITQQLPFGCHAWRKYEYEVFWKRYL